MGAFFADYAQTIIFVHVLSAFVWVGGMIVIRTAVHPALQSIDDPSIRLGKTLEITGRLFHLVIPFIVLLLVTALVMAIAVGGHHGALKSIFLSKEAIWSIMTLNFGFMYVRRAQAWQLFKAGDLASAKAKVALIPNILLPLNIVLGIVALWLGVSLRGV